jgi:anti-anti-sigma regulatory factor
MSRDLTSRDLPSREPAARTAAATVPLPAPRTRPQVQLTARGDQDPSGVAFLRDQLGIAARRGHDVVLDVSAYDHLAPATFAMLLRARWTAERAGHRLILTGVRAPVRRQLVRLGPPVVHSTSLRPHRSRRPVAF